MKIRIKNELMLMGLLVLALASIILLAPSNPLRAAIAVPAVLLFPGYSVISALFPSRSGPGGLERLALSIGASIAIVTLLGLGLHYTPVGIRLYTITPLLALVTLACSATAYKRRRSLPAEERFQIAFDLPLFDWKGYGAFDKTLSVVLIVAAIGALSTLGYVIGKPNVGEVFSELYILGLDGKASGYPTRLAAGDEGKVIVGIVNQEQKNVEYVVEIRVDGQEVSTLGPVELLQGQRSENEIGFKPAYPGDRQKVEFVLYRDGQLLYGDGGRYPPPHIWVDVTP